VIEPFLPYCGPSPLPADLWLRWNLDPSVLLGLAAALISYALAKPKARPGERRCFHFAVAGLFVAFVSPLCALTVALFSARVAHHVLLVAGVAPLLALAFAPRGPAIPLSLAFLLHTAVFWVWHGPTLYSLALSDTGIYWFMQASLLGSAWLMWRGIFNPATGRGYTMAALLGSIVQMGMLGALLTFAARPLYMPHLGTTGAFGLDPLVDQQLSGILMWVPASLPYLAVASLQLSGWLSGLGNKAAGRVGEGGARPPRASSTPAR
jgi:putative membrane protein